MGHLALGEYEEVIKLVDRAIQHDPTKAINLSGLSAIAYTQLGKHEEAKAAVKPAIEIGWNVTLSMYFTPDWQDKDFYADILLSLGNSGDFYKIQRMQKLTEDKIANLIVGNQITGYDFWSGKQWTIDGKNEKDVNFLSGEVIDHIKVWIEDDMFCRQWDQLLGGLKDCAYVYYNPEGKFEKRDEHILVTDYGFYGFSVIN